MPTRRSPCLRVVVPSPIPTGSMVWLGLTSTGCNPCWRSSGDCYKGDWRTQKLCGLFSAAGFDCFVNKKRPHRCLRGQVVLSAPSPWSRVAWRSTPGYEGLLLLTMWRGRRPVVSAANGCSHRGSGNGWRVTQSSCVCWS
jgi:hypothetical protein